MAATALTPHIHKFPSSSLLAANFPKPITRTRTRTRTRASFIPHASFSDPFVIQLAETLEASRPSSSSPLQKLRDTSLEAFPLLRLPSAPKINGRHLKCRAASSELQAPVGANARTAEYSSTIPSHKVTVRDRQRGVVHEFLVPEDQYILHTAEAQDISLPFACRHGCCTSCAVRIKSGQIRQPEALGISAELKSKGYALLCVGFPTSDLEVETQDEDEVYWLQFGRYFARGPIERDDYALELALGDE